MENNTLQDDHIDPDGYLNFEPEISETRPPPQTQGTPPDASKKRPSGQRGAYGRPITLKAGLHTTGSDDPAARPCQVRQAGPGRGRAGQGARPIRLKPDRGDRARDVPQTRKAQAKKTQGEKAETKRGKPQRTRGRKPRQRAKTAAPRPKRQPSVEATPRPRATAASVSRAAIPLASGHPVANPLEAWRSWASVHRRLLWAIGLSFSAGLLVHDWFAADDAPAVSQVAESKRPTQPPVPEVAAPGRQPTANPGYAPHSYAQPAPRRDGYPPLDGSYPGPIHTSAWPQHAPSSQYADTSHEWGGNGQQTTSRTPSATPWRQPGVEAMSSYWDGTRRQYNPWTRDDRMYR
jgi:hypothetical protein